MKTGMIQNHYGATSYISTVNPHFHVLVNIEVFHSGVAENAVLMGYDIAILGNRIPTFPGKVMTSSSRAEMLNDTS